MYLIYEPSNHFFHDILELIRKSDGVISNLRHWKNDPPLNQDITYFE